MYQIFFPSRNEWGQLYWSKVTNPPFYKNYKKAVKRCQKFGKYAYISKYGNQQPVYSNLIGEFTEWKKESA